MTKRNEPIARTAYNSLAVRYSALAEDKAENGLVEHPAMRERLGDVRGLSVLDAGCGPGILSRWLMTHGAKRVAGIDISPKMLSLAKKRCGSKADFHLSDLAKPMPFLETGSFDIVAASLAFDYVKNWRTPIREFRRVLRDGGRLVMTVQHPVSSYRWYLPQAITGIRKVAAEWKGFGGEPVTVPAYYRSVREMVMPLLKGGFSLVYVGDTLPSPKLKSANPDLYRKYMAFPPFMIIEARGN